ncbi:uncharacterized protein LOC131002549 [Salvia miltiorrhiza]|uniref:uncharacterized protein LOC131002549 n=1 Tax=Salvia miltiorrhiza TaxID=226208 RepID=UPI0025AC0248|nr:uncharacterized protein LOC131002549 [Salvia miltiorrhiza]
MDSGRLPHGDHDRSALNLPVISNNFSRSSPEKLSQAEIPTGNEKNPSDIDETVMVEEVVPTSEKEAVPTSSSGKKTTYAAALGPRVRKPDLSAHRFQALHTSSSGGIDTLKIPSDFLQQRVMEFKFALIGRLMLRKGSKPRLTQDLKAELQKIWNTSQEWQLIPMGKGFFTLKFSSLADKKVAKEKLNLEISDGCLRLREWVPKFDPYKECSSLAQVWVRIYYLPIELWHPEVIAAVGRYLGNPIRIDGGSADRDVGHYARVLIEIDLALPLRESLMIDEDNSSIYIEFSYESLPTFCNHCKIVGHTPEKCRKLKQREDLKNKKKMGDTGLEDKAGDSTQDRQQLVAEWQQKQPKANRPSMQLTETVPSEITATDTSKKCLEGGDSAVPVASKSKEADIPIAIGNSFLALSDNEKTGPDLIEKILVDASETKYDNIINIDPDQDGQQPDSLRLKGGASLDHNADLKVLALENAMKIQKLEAYIQEQEVKKKRGRPPGSRRGGKTLHTPAADSIKNRLRKSTDLGQKVQNFVIEEPESASLRTMHNLAAKSWAAEMELEETPSPDF